MISSCFGSFSKSCSIECIPAAGIKIISSETTLIYCDQVLTTLAGLPLIETIVACPLSCKTSKKSSFIIFVMIFTSYVLLFNYIPKHRQVMTEFLIQLLRHGFRKHALRMNVQGT